MSIEHNVVTYDLIDVVGNVKSTHCCYDSDLPSVKPPEGQMVRVRPQIGYAQRTVNHAVARAAEYPTVGDQLDVIWNVFAANPQLLTSAGRKMLTQIQSVKACYGKEKKFELNLGEGTTLYRTINNEEK